MREIKRMTPYLCVVLAAFYLLPLLITDTGSAIMILLVVIPFICFAVSLLYGIKGVFCWLYPVVVAVLYVPSIFVYYNASAWVYAAVFGVVALIGSVVGSFIAKRK